MRRCESKKNREIMNSKNVIFFLEKVLFYWNVPPEYL